MATKTVTCVANGFKFEDPTGIQHTVTTGQTFTFELTDGGASAVTYQQNNATSVTTTDGRTLIFRPDATNASGTNGGVIRSWGPTADAQDGVAVLSLRGEFKTQFTEGGLEQCWSAETLTVDNIDAPTLISGRWKDQFGRHMDWAGLTVA
jgi:hypothetical protein